MKRFVVWSAMVFAASTGPAIVHGVRDFPREINGLKSDTLRIGQTINVPQPKE